MVATFAGLRPGVPVAVPTLKQPSQPPGTVDDTGTNDVTTSLQTWIDGQPDNVDLRMRSTAIYRVEGQLQFTARTNMQFDGGGANLKALNAPTESVSMVQFRDSVGMGWEHVKMTAAFATPGVFNSALQHAHAVDCRGSSVTVADVSILNFAGDGLYAGQGLTSAHTWSQVIFGESSVTGVGRNIWSGVAAQNCVCVRVTYSSIGLFGFDVEPNSGADFGASNILVTQCSGANCHSATYQIVMNNPIDGVSFIDNKTTDVNGMKVQVIHINDAPQAGSYYRPTRITFTGNVGTNQGNPFGCYIEHADGIVFTGNTLPLWCSAAPGRNYVLQLLDCTNYDTSGNDLSGQGGPNPPATMVLVSGPTDNGYADPLGFTDLPYVPVPLVYGAGRV